MNKFKELLDERNKIEKQYNVHIHKLLQEKIAQVDSNIKISFYGDEITAEYQKCKFTFHFWFFKNELRLNGRGKTLPYYEYMRLPYNQRTDVQKERSKIYDYVRSCVKSVLLDDC